MLLTCFFSSKITDDKLRPPGCACYSTITAGTCVPQHRLSCRCGVDREVEQKTSKADILQDTLKIDDKH